VRFMLTISFLPGNLTLSSQSPSGMPIIAEAAVDNNVIRIVKVITP